jgi:hypothetical protein
LKEGKLDPRKTFGELAERGCMAVEAYHRDHPVEVGNQLAKAARQCGLGVTGGS